MYLIKIKAIAKFVISISYKATFSTERNQSSGSKKNYFAHCDGNYI